MAEQRVPQTLEECFEVLRETWSPEDLDMFRTTPRSELIQFHFGLGMGIRNAWGLWQESPLFHDLRRRGCVEPDDMSSYIVESFHDRLNDRPLSRPFAWLVDLPDEDPLGDEAR